MSRMMLSAKGGIRQIVETLAAMGLREVVLCPGSRNAPLVISFNRHTAFRCTSIRDERSAAFFAMGMALELKQPVAVVSTSGSAALNFAPAISEAYYQRIPLIVITADRLKEWTDQGDGQTINQTNLYQNYIRKSYELRGDAASESDRWHNNRCLNEGWNIATLTNKGPVHFNIPLSEPLYQVEAVEPSKVRVFSEVKVDIILPEDALYKLQSAFIASKKVMILVGQHAKNTDLESAIIRLAGFENVVVLTESTANIAHPDFVKHIDRCITTLSDEDAAILMPDLLITLGGAIVSKRIKSILRKFSPQEHWLIGQDHDFVDTYQSLTLAIPMQSDVFFSQLSRGLKDVASHYRKDWLMRKQVLENLHDQFCKAKIYSDFSVFDEIFKNMGYDVHLHLSNSSPIRYAQLFESKRVADTWCNRGTSGIDGCTSTAMGAAYASPNKQFLLISGDVAFNYDINALWHDHIIENLNIIVINNGGGGIFRIISGPDTIEEMEPYFETSMDTNLIHVAQRFQWEYLTANDDVSLKIALDKIMDANTKKCILEIFTEPQTNPAVLKKYWDFLKNEHSK